MLAYYKKSALNILTAVGTSVYAAREDKHFGRSMIRLFWLMHGACGISAILFIIWSWYASQKLTNMQNLPGLGCAFPSLVKMPGCEARRSNVCPGAILSQ